ncbi:entericidin A/B family lipoprotein [Pollutimonas bauzanensis]|uniref:Entericidin EcnA/B family protein n=1 Tax=Pollutimonas bauzanensis TaxID=658167 RepID=A0A1M5MFK1_9BURK|nr:entericidin A/B family lipoprotein [Pollutimonas bauzanensis]SHG75649.1 Entericidin EcnA/B family protein [Pollutimonas bauzanensis]
MAARILACLALLGCIALAGCNTMAGAGEDISKAGGAITKSANK